LWRALTALSRKFQSQWPAGGVSPASWNRSVRYHITYGPDGLWHAEHVTAGEGKAVHGPCIELILAAYDFVDGIHDIVYGCKQTLVPERK